MSTTSPEGRSPEDVREHPVLYRKLRIGGASIVVVLLVFAASLWDSPLLEVGNIAFSGGSIGLAFVAMYLALSLYSVDPDSIAGAFCYGKSLIPLPSGLHFLPFGLIQPKMTSRLVQEFQCPGEPEQIFKGDDKDALPPEMFRPIRVVTRAPEPGAEGGEILNTQMTLVVSFVFQYVVNDIFDYVTNFNDDKTVRIQLRDIGEATIAEEATSKTASDFIKGLKELNVSLRNDVENRFRNSGVQIISARLISPDITHEVSKALADIPVARAKAKRTEIRAAAFRKLLEERGEGRANAEFSLLSAEAKGRKEMKVALKVSGEDILASEAVRGILGKTDVLVAGAEGGMRDMMGLVKGAQSALKLNQTKGTM